MKFLRKIFETWQFWKSQFSWVGHFEMVFFKKKNLLHSHENQSKFIDWWMGQNFDQMRRHFLTRAKHFDGECMQDLYTLVTNLNIFLYHRQNNMQGFKYCQSSNCFHQRRSNSWLLLVQKHSFFSLQCP